MSRIALFLLLFLLSARAAVLAAQPGETWTPTPPRLSFVDGDVSHWRLGADRWAAAPPNLALAEGDALYAGDDSNLEVQFGPRSFVRADANSELSLVAQQERRIQFKVAGGRVSFDLRSWATGDTLEISTPNAVFVVERPGYYRVEVGSPDTHFITRRGGEATVITADGRSLAIYSSEDVVITAGVPVQVATYAAPPPDDWDRWNDARSDRLGDSVSARYLPPGIYGSEDLDYYGHWRVVAAYGPVWIPYGVSVGWVPYSTGYWVWDPYYAWTWVDDAPWGWAPFHYGRWVYIDGFWAWAPGPVVRYPIYAPALVAFMVPSPHVSQIRIGLPGLWWVALSWGEPVIPWWGPPRHRGHPWWGGWGGPHIVNGAVVKPAAVINAGDIRFRNAALPHAILTVPAETFGHERIRATVENRYRHPDFAVVRGELPVKHSPASLYGGAPKGIRPPQEMMSRPVVSTRKPREPVPEQVEASRPRTEVAPEPRFVIPPARRESRPLPRPPFGDQAGPERTPPPRPPSYEELRKAVGQPRAFPRESVREGAGPPAPAARPAQPFVVAPPPAGAPGSAPARRPGSESALPPFQPKPGPPMLREQGVERQRAPPALPERPMPQSPHPQAPAVGGPQARPEAAPRRGEARQETHERPLPGKPANQIYGGPDRGKGRDASGGNPPAR